MIERWLTRQNADSNVLPSQRKRLKSAALASGGARRTTGVRCRITQGPESGQFELCGPFTLTGHYGNSDGLIARLSTVLVKAFGWHYFAAMQASEIVVALRANEADAPEELFDNYGEQLITYCWRLLRNEDATLIAVRDTMIVAQAHAGRLRDPERIGPWLLALARSECDRRARAAGHAVKAAKAGDPPAAPPTAATMRQEVLTCLTDPRLARYRAVAAARMAALDATGFPASAAAMRAVRWPRWHRGAGRVALDATGPTAGGVAPQAVRRPPRRRPHLGGGVLTVSVACTAAVILLAAGVSLQGATAPAAPAASASSAAPGAPALADSARPQGRPVAVTSVAPRSPDLDTPGQPTSAQTQQGLYAISSQPGASGRLLSGSRRGGQAPPVPQGMPPVPVPATSSPWSTSWGTRPPWPGHQWTPPSSPASPTATPTPSPWSPAPWPTRPDGRTWPSATTPPASTPAPEATATMAAVWSPDAATTRGPAPAPGATATPRAGGNPVRPCRPPVARAWGPVARSRAGSRRG
jgi:DNA-directed RNA polymerase specialized sigma24 family protein